MEQIFEFLDAEGLSSMRAVARILKWNKRRILRFLDEANDLLPHEITRSSQLFAFHASSTLGGAPKPCRELECRLKQVDRLTRFAALYADEVLIQPSVTYSASIESSPISEVRTSVVTDLTVLHRLRPLFDEKILRFLPRPAFCEHHWNNVLRETALDTAKKALLKELGSRVDVSVEQCGDSTFVHFIGPETCLDHGHEVFQLGKEQRFVLDDRRDAEGNPFICGRDRKALLEKKAWPVIADLVAQELYGKAAGARYLTNRELDSVALTATNPRSKEPRNVAVQEAFLHELPFLSDARVSDLLRLRRYEGEAFAVYRDAISAALGSANSTQPEHLRELFRDVVQPKLNAIDARVRAAKKCLAGKIKSDFVLGAGVVTVALASGFLMPNAAAIIAAIGGVPFGIEVLRNLNELLKEPGSARDDEFYFLWKVKQMAEGRTNQAKKNR